jgi:Icc protein
MATVVQLSDTHLTAATAAPAEALRAAVDAIGAAVPSIDLVLLTGDLSDDGGVEATAEVRAIAERLGAPLAALGGNHDDPAVVAEVFGPSTPVVVGGWCVVPIATSVPGEIAGRVDLARAKTALDGAETTGLDLLVALHHPPAGPSTHPWFVLEGADAFLADATRRPTVRAFATGHLHQAFVHPTAGPPVVGAPSTLYAIRHTADRWEKAPGDVVGATIWTLDADGACSHRFLSTTG